MSGMCFLTNCNLCACSVARVFKANPRGEEGEMGLPRAGEALCDGEGDGDSGVGLVGLAGGAVLPDGPVPN